MVYGEWEGTISTGIPQLQVVEGQFEKKVDQKQRERKKKQVLADFVTEGERYRQIVKEIYQNVYLLDVSLSVNIY